jgi:starch-binding outer membrane protein, SusD/RagB family
MNKLFIIISLAILFSSCSESYLDKSEDVDTINEDEVFSTYYNMRHYADNMYNMIFNTNAIEVVGDNKHYSHPIVFSDEGIASYPRTQYDAGIEGNYLYYTQKGSGNGLYEFTYPYEAGWQGIRIANVTLEKIDQPKDITDEQKAYLTGECAFVRAMCYFQILKRYGGMPYFRHSLNLTEYLGFDRLSYYETAKEIAADCDLAYEKLPHVWNSSNTGRPIKAAALALKSRVLLYAASPTYNTENDLTKWEEAAVAANELIEYIESDKSYHALIDASEAIELDVQSVDGEDYLKASPEKLKNYREIFMHHVLNSEIIFSYYRETNHYYNNTMPGRVFFTKDYLRNKFSMGACPTQDVVDWFETQNGLSPEDDPAFNAQNPYVNRDPRFYNDILYNGVTWPNGKEGDVVETYATGSDGSAGKDFMVNSSDWPNSHTGYMARKFWPEGISGSTSAGKVPFIVPAVWFRVSEAYLSYAEAAYEASGRTNFDAKYPAGAVYTAKSAINKIRNRVGMPDINARYLNNTDFIQRIRNERSVEFCFEDGHRWWDIRRWHIAHTEEIRTVYRMNIDWVGISPEYPTGFMFSRVKHDIVKGFEERHYFYPLKIEDVSIHKEFDQNPGW